MEEPATDTPHRAPSRRRLYLILTPIVVLTALAYVGDIFWADLANRNPYLLIALNTRKRYLALVVPNTAAVPYFLVGVIRQVLSDPLFYLLGWFYGDAGVRWLERKLGEGGSMVRAMERGFAKASWPMVALFPNSLVCMLAGASKMPPAAFIALNVGGTVVAMVLLRLFGNAFSSPLERLLDFLAEYRWWIVGISAVLVAIQIIQNRRKGTSELEPVSSLEQELEEAAQEVEAEHAEEPDDGDGRRAGGRDGEP